MAHRQLGNLQIMRVLEMIMPFDSSAFFPHVTAQQWEPHLQWLAPEGFNRETRELYLPMQSYVVRTSRHTILVDGCVGNHKQRPSRPRWHLKDDEAYMQALAAHGLSVQDIDFVLCTHLHADHVGWNTRLQDGRWVPTFPNARYVFSDAEVTAWRDTGHEKFARAPFEDSVLPILEAGRAQLVANDFALDDEVWLESTPGHTPDHVAVNLRSGDGHAVMCGDLMHSPVQCLHPEWVPWPDWDPDRAHRTRREFMERYCETDTLICTAHFPLPSAGWFVRRGDAFGFDYDDGGW